MVLEVLNVIYDGLLQGLGANWIVATCLFIVALAVMLAVIRLNAMFAVAVVALPFLLLAIYQTIQYSYGIGIVVLVLGFILAIALHRLFIKQ